MEATCLGERSREGCSWVEAEGGHGDGGWGVVRGCATPQREPEGRRAEIGCGGSGVVGCPPDTVRTSLGEYEKARASRVLRGHSVPPFQLTSWPRGSERPGKSHNAQSYD